MNPRLYEIPICVDYSKTTALKMYSLSTVTGRAAEGTKTQDTRARTHAHTHTQLLFQTHTHLYNYQL
jgi:hypothetical protein